MAADEPQRESIFSWAVQWLANRKAIREAPPSKREVEVTYVLLEHRDNNQLIGAFSPALYVMARAKGAPEKEAFKTAIIPPDHCADIENFFENAITLEDRSKAALPAPVDASYIEKEFLSELHKTKFKIREGKYLKKFKVDNNRTTAAEKFLYYAMHWMATFLILFAIVELVATFALTIPSRMWLLFSLGYVVNIIVKFIGIFDLTESMIKNAWMLNKKYVWEGKWDFHKSLKTSILLAIMSYFVFTATRGAWEAAMGASVWKVMTVLEAPSMVITVFATFTAGSIALITAGLTWFGLERSIRSALPVGLPFTFFNNTISPEAINVLADELLISEEKNPRSIESKRATSSRKEEEEEKEEEEDKKEKTRENEKASINLRRKV